MNIKRTIAVITTLTLVFSLFISTNVFAENGISEDKLKLMIAAGEILPTDMPDESDVKIKKVEAIELAEAMLDDPESYEVAYTSLNKKWDVEGYIWNIEFRISKTPGGSANVNIDADTGEILYYSCWEGTEPQQNFVAKMTREEARVKAEEFLINVMKLDISTLELQNEDPYAYYYRMGGTKEAVTYNFNYLRTVNDIPLQNSNVGVSIDGTSGKIRSYNISSFAFDVSKFPAVQEIITPEQAMEKYKENMAFALQYITAYDEKPYGAARQRTLLAYVPITYVNMIDAKTGEISNPDGYYMPMDIETVEKLYEDPAPINPDAVISSRAVNEAEAGRIADVIKGKVEKLLGVSFDTPSETSYDMPRYYTSEQDIWNYTWNKYDENGTNIFLSVSINGKTGHILNIGLSNWDRTLEYAYKEGTEPAAITENVTWEQGKDKALSIMRTLVPRQYGFFADQNIIKPEYDTEAFKYVREHSYSYSRVVDGILYRDNNMNVTIDRETGNIRNFNINWSDTEFPSADGIIGSEEALDKYSQGMEAKLVYFWQSTYDNMTQLPKYADAPVLVYTYRANGLVYNSQMIDAKTGEFIDWSGREIMMDAVSGDVELADHWAKRSAELLIAQGILKNPNVVYDDGVTRAEAVKMVSLAKGMWYYDQSMFETSSFPDVPVDDDNFFYIESAVKNKLITADGSEFNGSEKIDKEEFTKLLVNLIGYSDIAKYEDIFKLGAEVNVSDDMTGYVAVCRALDILPVKTGEVLDGKSGLTYAEAVTALYKALSFIK